MMIIDEWKRNGKGDKLRIVLDKHAGREVVVFRNYYRDDDGKYKPGRQGINLDIKHVPRIAKAFRKAKRVLKKSRQ